MAEERQHRQLFGLHHKEEEEERLSDEVAYTGSDGDSQTIEESVEDNEKVKRGHKDKEQLGEIDALTDDDDLYLYEKEEAKKEPEHGHESNIEEEQVSTIVRAGCAGCACHERHEKKEGKEKEEKEEEEEEEEEEAETKKKHQT